MTRRPFTATTGIFLAALALTAGAGAQEEPAAESPVHHFEVSPATGPIKIDGVLDEPA